MSEIPNRLHKFNCKQKSIHNLFYIYFESTDPIEMTVNDRYKDITQLESSLLLEELIIYTGRLNMQNLLFQVTT